MIVRARRGKTSVAKAPDHERHFQTSVIPELKRIDGLLGATLHKQVGPTGVEFLVLTRWKSMEAVRAFAGPNPDKAVVGPDAMAALIDYDRTVQHYEVVEDLAV